MARSTERFRKRTSGRAAPGGPLAVPDLEDAVAQDGQLDHDLAQVQAFAQPFQRMPLRRRGVETGALVDDGAPRRCPRCVEQVGDVVDEGGLGQALGGRTVFDGGMPALQDGVAMCSQELREL